jgi:hypothetical protein
MMFIKQFPPFLTKLNLQVVKNSHFSGLENV